MRSSLTVGCKRLLVVMYQGSQFIDLKGGLTSVKHCMAVRADRNEVIDRIYAVAHSDGSNGNPVVHVNKSGSKVPVLLDEV